MRRDVARGISSLASNMGQVGEFSVRGSYKKFLFEVVSLVILDYGLHPILFKE